MQAKSDWFFDKVNNIVHLKIFEQKDVKLHALNHLICNVRPVLWPAEAEGATGETTDGVSPKNGREDLGENVPAWPVILDDDRSGQKREVNPSWNGVGKLPSGGAGGDGEHHTRERGLGKTE